MFLLLNFTIHLLRNLFHSGQGKTPFIPSAMRMDDSDYEEVVQEQDKFVETIKNKQKHQTQSKKTNKKRKELQNETEDEIDMKERKSINVQVASYFLYLEIIQLEQLDFYVITENEQMKQPVTKKKKSEKSKVQSSGSRMSDDEAAASASDLFNSSFIDQQLESEYEGVKIASVDEKLSVVKSPPNYDLILRKLNKVQGTSAIQKTVLGLQ